MLIVNVNEIKSENEREIHKERLKKGGREGSFPGE